MDTFPLPLDNHTLHINNIIYNIYLFFDNILNQKYQSCFHQIIYNFYKFQRSHIVIYSYNNLKYFFLMDEHWLLHNHLL